MKETLALLGDRLRAAILVLLVVISVILGGLRLMKIQVVNGTAYLEKAQSTAVYAQPVGRSWTVTAIPSWATRLAIISLWKRHTSRRTMGQGMLFCWRLPIC